MVICKIFTAFWFDCAVKTNGMNVDCRLCNAFTNREIRSARQIARRLTVSDRQARCQHACSYYGTLQPRIHHVLMDSRQSALDTLPV